MITAEHLITIEHKEPILPTNQDIQEFSAGEFISMIGEAKNELLTKFGFKLDTCYHSTKAEDYDWN